MKTQDELKKFAMDFVDDKIFTSDMVGNSNNLGMHFMPILLGGLKDKTKSEIEDMWVLYQYYGVDQSPTSINGLPCFTSLKWLTKAECEIVNAYAKEYQELKAAFQNKDKNP